MQKIPLLLIIFMALLITGFNEPAETAMALRERNKQEMMRFYEEVFNKHNVGLIDTLVSPDYIEHQTDVHYSSDRKGLKKEFTDYFNAFPDARIKIHFILAEGDMVTAQYTITATHRGTIYGKEPTNRKINISGIDVVRFKNGIATEHWGYLEEGKLLTQLGVFRELMKKDKAKASAE